MSGRGSFFAALAIFATSLNASSESIESVMAKLPEPLKAAAEFTLKILPDRSKAAVNNYISTLGAEVSGGRNAGIVAHNAQILKERPCFKQLAGEFYSSLRAQDIEQLIHALESGDSKVFFPPKLNMTIDNAGLKPGWLWDEALRFSGGDPNLAVDLIGLCGHDDESQLQEGVSFTGVGAPIRNAADRLRKVRESPEYSSKIKRLALDMRKVSPNSSISQEIQVLSIGADVGGLLKVDRIGCPMPSSPMYHAQALGEEYDLSDALKKKIARIQAPTLGASVLPSKAYHVIGSAMASCKLVQGGVMDLAAKNLVKHAVNGYRAGRLCSDRLNQVFDGYDWGDADQVSKKALAFRKNPDSKSCFVKVDNANPHLDPIIRMDAGPECKIGRLFSYGFWFDSDLSDEMLTKKINRSLGERDAAMLFKKSPAFAKSDGCASHQFTFAVRDFLYDYSLEGKRNNCPKDWSEERCKRARQILSTYAVDFEWSESQHLAGYEFAKKHCRPVDEKYDPNTQACKAIGELLSTKSNRSVPEDGAESKGKQRGVR